MENIYTSDNPIINDDFDIQLDHPLIKTHEVLGEVVERYAEKMESLEANFELNSMNSTISLIKTILNPFILILLLYLTLVLVQLIIVSRSALRGKLLSIFDQPKRVKVLAFSAMISLGATWYNMILYLFWSYNSFLKRIQLTGDEIPSLPICKIQSIKGDFDCILTKSIVHSLRIQQWLRSTSLFIESWLHVVGTNLNWWWSVEVCLFTVGVWATFVRIQGKRFNVSNLWLFMLLGQTCSISVAQNLFSLALAMKGLPDSSRTGRQSNFTQAALDVDLIPPPSSPAGKRTRKITLQSIAKPTVSSRLFVLFLTFSGLFIVFKIPSDFLSILIMHTFPFILVLPIANSNFNFLPLNFDEHFQLSTIYTSMAIITLFIRLQSHLSILNNDNTSIQKSIQNLLHSSLEHPAQTSISADAICITFSIFLDLYYQQASGVLNRMYAYCLIILTPLIGPSTTFAISLAIREAQLEKVSKSLLSDENPMTPVKVLTNSISKSKVKSNSSSTIKKSSSNTSLRSNKSIKSKMAKKNNNSSDDDDHDTDTQIETPSKSSNRRKSIAKSTTTRKRTTSLKSNKKATSEVEQSDVDGPAARAKRTRARPRNKEMMDGEMLIGNEEEVSNKLTRTPKRMPSTRGRVGRGRGATKKGD